MIGVLSNFGEKIKNTLGLFGVSRFRKDVPKSQGLVSGASDNRFAVRADGQIEHTVAVSGEFGQLGHHWVLPDEDLILRVAVGGDELVGVFGPGEVADLRPSVYRLEVLPG